MFLKTELGPKSESDFGDNIDLYVSVGIGVVIDCLGPESKSESDYLEMCRLHTPQPWRHSKSGRGKPA